MASPLSESGSAQNAIGPLRTQADRLAFVANHRTVVVSTPPAEQAVTLAEAKGWMRITDTANDTAITSLIKGCQAAIESLIGQKLVTQSLTLTLDQWGEVYTPLDLGPVASVTSVTVSGTLTASTRYRLINNGAGIPNARIVDDGAGLPDPLEDLADIVVIYVAGYGAASAVPEEIKNALLWFIQVAYDDPKATMPKISRSLLAPHISIKV